MYIEKPNEAISSNEQNPRCHGFGWEKKNKKDCVVRKPKHVDEDEQHAVLLMCMYHTA